MRPQVQQLKERASKEGQAALDADQRAKLASEDALIQEIRSLGGDEFLVLVPLLDVASGLRYAERLAAAIGSQRAATPWEHLVPSASVGVSPVRHIPLPMAQLDAALYHAKRHNKGHAALPPT